MYTSNFRISGTNPKAISIALYSPKWYKGREFKALAPKKYMLKIKDQEEYKRVYYREILKNLDPVQIYDILKDKILLCWEKPGEFCHRRLVAEWIERNTGIKTQELDYKPKRKTTQGSLF